VKSEQAQKLIDSADSAQNVIGFLMFGAIGILSAAYGFVVITLSAARILAGPPRLGGKTPEEAVRRFYRCALNDGLDGMFNYMRFRPPSTVEAYGSITNDAKKDFDGWKGFHAHWKYVRPRVTNIFANVEASVSSLDVRATDREHATYQAEIRLDISEGGAKSVSTKSAIGHLTRYGERWYLADGKWGAGLAWGLLEPGDKG
jgi:hypothetical protein